VIAKKGGHGAETKTTTEVKHFFASSPALDSKGGAAYDSHSDEVIAKERWLAALSVVLAVIGMLIGWFAFIKTPLRQMPKILEQKWRLDEFYNGYIVDPITNISREGLWKGFDVGFIDGIVNGIGNFVAAVGSSVRRIQVGFIRSYAAMIVFGALALLGYFIYYGFKLVG
jgi:NADH-quinone oxidoreductase subunit L